MINIPEAKLGLVAVSRDCFPVELSARRRAAVWAACNGMRLNVYECGIVVENETDMMAAMADLEVAGVNALVVFLGNFGPEAPEVLLAKHFKGPTMFAAAAEDGADLLVSGRGDAYCGMLNCSYNLGLRKIPAHIPQYPVGNAADVAAMILDFVPVARVLIGLSSLKIITFGPRPQDFFACNAPIKPLFDLGIEIQENSELDLLAAFNAHEGDPRIDGVVADMAAELGSGNKMAGILPKLARFELTLLDWAEKNKGSREYVVFANKCWPAFQTQFGFVPCYVNSRLAARGIPVACEVDIYGALSEYIGACATNGPVTLLDINNTVPKDLYEMDIKGKFPYSPTDVFMGFHCGNTPICKINKGELKHQLIMHRLLEPEQEPDITRGTLEGDIVAGKITFFRLQSTADGMLRAYVAQGEVLPVATRSFGGIGIFAIEEMGRFYRHVLIADKYPHHGAVAFGHAGRVLYDVFAYLGIEKISFNQPADMLYTTENPFK